MPESRRIDPILIASYLIAAVGLMVVLLKGLVAALLSGLLVYSLVHLMTPLLGRRLSSERARMVAVACIGLLTVSLLCVATWFVVNFLQSDAGSLQVLFQKMADIIDQSRDQIPVWLISNLPEGAQALREMVTAWLHAHAIEAKLLGQETGRTLVHILIGMIIGAMAALYDSTPQIYLPLAAALRARMINLSNAFQSIVFAQVRIAAINAILISIYLLIVLPLAGVHLPLSKTLIALTFFAGLIPVAGNLMSNAVLVILGLSHSLDIAVVSLIFMVVVHKLEYFLNAKIIGRHINARAWELLVAILVMEASFGLAGIIAAPVLYAYLKKELHEQRLV
ncbi:putative PurR-regulated permease PerM [Actimicrobium sp. GrIS 1.19]|uniref:AI-2E family transporter n=1 Tax=Actimicrobium sp. GrIS 1.19 TaxID=3071708 RepID=UPI002E082643|nr:putative PurR-regulated permease PerM [Actimicrobium sp. GrIS 1.19]